MSRFLPLIVGLGYGLASYVGKGGSVESLLGLMGLGIVILLPFFLLFRAASIVADVNIKQPKQGRGPWG